MALLVKHFYSVYFDSIFRWTSAFLSLKKFLWITFVLFICERIFLKLFFKFSTNYEVHASMLIFQKPFQTDNLVNFSHFQPYIEFSSFIQSSFPCKYLSAYPMNKQARKEIGLKCINWTKIVSEVQTKLRKVRNSVI